MYRKGTQNICWLTSVPIDIPAEARKVDLTGNSITHTELGSFQNLTVCYHLYLDANYISRIEYGTFVGLHSLTYLGLKSNVITHIDTWKPILS